MSPPASSNPILFRVEAHAARLSIPAIQVSARWRACCGGRIGIANALDMLFPIYAVIAAVIVTDPRQWRRGINPCHDWLHHRRCDAGRG